jgi:hypothetical protein
VIEYHLDSQSNHGFPLYDLPIWTLVIACAVRVWWWWYKAKEQDEIIMGIWYCIPLTFRPPPVITRLRSGKICISTGTLSTDVYRTINVSSAKHSTSTTTNNDY